MGRPTKQTEEAEALMLAAVEEGLPFKLVAAARRHDLSDSLRVASRVRGFRGGH